ncbi:hypothetical protein ABN306_21665 [Providencia huaxiensis]|uniref:hypothetical protein n=1 Tax=Providencia huaxiensis TaxID=2027290 RepID=UPI001B37B79D|nr:hypothetical protein [Providencia huaxiensis]MBQ0536750.1 hypothetical protein [Providencia huaxiensis]MBQ0590850.1 hypothetical protein [Providencia huaxiensis]MCG9536464.1 hypothetical protein [Providencia huaxiensis]MDI7241519.1 hypothetical protein [Providencia huaxiensis]
MSNNVYGYLQPEIGTTIDFNLLEKYMADTPLNIRVITKMELFNYPAEYLPEDGCFIFDIADGKNSINATYLIDYLEYDPETADIGFPPDPKERLNILLDTLSEMIKISNAKKMVVSLNECEQIETIKKIRVFELYDVIHADFEEYQAPPDTLYEIIA